MVTITSENIPRSIGKKQRARLINLQRKKVMRQLKAIQFVFEPQTMERVVPYSPELEPVGMTEAFVDTVNRTEFKWRVNCYLLTRESDGKNKLIDHEVMINTPCRHEEIAGMIADALYQQVEEFRESRYAGDFITAAWIAGEINTETSLDDAYAIFDGVGAWKLPTDREEMSNEK